MSTNPPPPIPPYIADDDGDESTPTVDVDGQEKLDPDADPDRIAGATADRIAAEGGVHDDES
jgi:hypothetical protein